MGYLYDDHTQPGGLAGGGAGATPGCARSKGSPAWNPGTLVNQVDFEDPAGHRHTPSFRPTRGARSANMPRTNPHEDFIHIFQDMYGHHIDLGPDRVPGRDPR